MPPCAAKWYGRVTRVYALGLLRMRMRLGSFRFPLGHIELPAGTAVASHMLVHIPAGRRVEPHKIFIRQMYREREVGRITWLMLPRR